MDGMKAAMKRRIAKAEADKASEPPAPPKEPREPFTKTVSATETTGAN